MSRCALLVGVIVHVILIVAGQEYWHRGDESAHETTEYCALTSDIKAACDAACRELAHAPCHPHEDGESYCCAMYVKRPRFFPKPTRSRIITTPRTTNPPSWQKITTSTPWQQKITTPNPWQPKSTTPNIWQRKPTESYYDEEYSSTIIQRWPWLK